MLSPDAARAFRLAGLHPGPDFDGYAAAALSRATLPQASRRWTQLARAHLLQCTGAGPVRHARPAARLRAVNSPPTDGEDEQRAALTRLFGYYLHTAATAMDSAFPAERAHRPAVAPASTPAPAFSTGAAALIWLAAERPSLVAVTVHAAGHGWPGHATRLSAVVFRYLDTECLYPEATTVHSHARQAASRLGDQRAEAGALHSLGVIDLRQGRHRRAAGRFGKPWRCSARPGTGWVRPARSATSASSASCRGRSDRPASTWSRRWPCFARSATRSARPACSPASGTSPCDKAATSRPPGSCTGH